MKGRLWGFVKRCLFAFFIWLGLTAVFVWLDNSFELSQKINHFSLVALVVPIFFAAFYIASGFYKSSSSKTELKDYFWSFGKSLLPAFLIWFGLTTVLAWLGSFSGASQKFEWYSWATIVVPILRAYPKIGGKEVQ